MKELSNSKELSEVMTKAVKEENSKSVVIIGAPWCPYCQNMISWAKEQSFIDQLPEGVEVYAYETNQDEVGDETSFIRKGITDLTGEEVFGLPSIFYLKGSDVKTGGFTPKEEFLKKIKEYLA